MSKKEIQINPKVTNTTRVVIYLMVFGVFSVCAFLLPELALEEKAANPNAGTAIPFFAGAWIMSLPIFVALRETLKILTLVDQNTAFSMLTVKAISNIKKSATVFGMMVILATLTMIFVVHNMHPEEDAPPFGLFGMVFTFVSIVITTFAATLERLLKDALHLKEENDLTV